MTCELMQDAIFGDGPRPEGFDAHLESCATCREALAGHRAALSLKGAEVYVPQAGSRAPGLRPATVAAVLFIFVVGPLVGLVVYGHDARHAAHAHALAAHDAVNEPGTDLPLTATPLENSMKAQPTVASADQPLDDEQRAWLAVWRASDLLAYEVRRDVSVVDPAYASFRSLPAWLAPRPVELWDDGTLTHTTPQE